MKYRDIKIDVSELTEDQRADVQRKLFEDGCKWRGETVYNVERLDKPFLYVNDEREIMWGNGHVCFSEHDFNEVSPWDIIEKPAPVDIKFILNKLGFKQCHWSKLESIVLFENSYIEFRLKDNHHMNGVKYDGLADDLRKCHDMGVEPLTGLDITDNSKSGGSAKYYRVQVDNPITIKDPYEAECNDIMEALKLDPNEVNVFKELWRMANARNGNGKEGNTDQRAAEKIVWFACRMAVNAGVDVKKLLAPQLEK